MKLTDLKEVTAVAPLRSMGADMNDYTDRTFLSKENGYDIYSRQHKTLPNHVMYDIDQVAFVAGELFKFSGKIKNTAFSMNRVWVNADHRGKGLTLSILQLLFNKQHYALLTDNLVTQDGRKQFDKLISVIRITNVYKVDDQADNISLVDVPYMKQHLMDDNIRFVMECVENPNSPITKMGIPPFGSGWSTPDDIIGFD